MEEKSDNKNEKSKYSDRIGGITEAVEPFDSTREPESCECPVQSSNGQPTATDSDLLDLSSTDASDFTMDEWLSLIHI